MPWRPANITNLPPEAAHVINQLLRETNARIDSLQANQSPHQTLRGSAVLHFGTVSANSTVTRSFTLLGVTSGAAVSASPTLILDSSHQLGFQAWAPSKNTISISVTNPTTGAITANTVKWTVFCIL